MAAKINWHKYGTKLRHCHPMYVYIGGVFYIYAIRFSPPPCRQDAEKCLWLWYCLNMLCWWLSGHFLKLNWFSWYLNDTINIHPLIPSIMPCCTHKMAIASWLDSATSIHPVYFDMVKETVIYVKCCANSCRLFRCIFYCACLISVCCIYLLLPCKRVAGY